MMPCSGKRATISRRMTSSAPRSATVTGDESGLSSIAIGVRKYGRITAPAASASSVASARAASNKSAAALEVKPEVVAGTGPYFTDRRLLQRLQIDDHIGAVLHLGQTREAHLGALRKGLRFVEPDVQLVRIPLLALVCGQRLGELIAFDVGDVLFHDAEQVRPDLVGAAFLKGMALQARL